MNQGISARLRRKEGYWTKRELADACQIDEVKMYYLIRSKVVPAPTHRVNGSKRLHYTSDEVYQIKSQLRDR